VTPEEAMSVIRVSVSIALASVIGLSLGLPLGAADDPLVRAKELYRTAAYDEALGILDGISDSSPSATIEVNEYRVFCLVALDRKDDAKSAITALVTADPSYQLSEAQASPRVRAVFKEVREALLPSIIQHTYADAKAAFDKKDPQAGAQFERVLTLLKDPDLKPTPELTDLAVVAAAFRDLSAARDAAAAPRAAAPAAAPVVPSKPAEPIVYRDGEPNFTPATVINQALPTAVLPERRIYTGAVEVLIDETGKVLSAKMAMPIAGAYDRQLIQTALNTWKYKPALKNGAPARYTKIVNVRVDARPACTTFENADCRPANPK
jgi:hypothetical protein